MPRWGVIREGVSDASNPWAGVEVGLEHLAHAGAQGQVCGGDDGDKPRLGETLEPAGLIYRTQRARIHPVGLDMDEASGARISEVLSRSVVHQQVVWLSKELDGVPRKHALSLPASLTGGVGSSVA